MTENVVSKGYNLMKWGILLSGLHINIHTAVGGLQIIPSFIGFAMVAYAINMMYKAGGARYFEKLKKDAVTVTVAAVVLFVWGLLFGYVLVVSQAMTIIAFLIELLMYADLLNMTVRLYKDNNEIKSADKLRTDRITFIKAGMGLAILHAAAMIPALNQWLNYSCVTLMFVYKIWLSLILQNVSKKNMVMIEGK